MDYIITLFKILFFSQTVLLTPTPIDIKTNISIDINNISAISKGASIRIDISSMFDTHKNLNEITKEIYKLFPPKNILAYLYNDENNLTIPLYYNKGLSFSKNSVELILSNDKEMQIDVDFNRISFKTKIPLKNIKIFWKNASN